jgi:hypothetical protein
MTDYPIEQRIGRKLRRMQHDDAREAAESTPEAMVKAMREQLNQTFPTATPEEIEAEIARRLARGGKPTTASVPPSPGIPQDVQAARRAERKRVVASNKHLRR